MESVLYWGTVGPFIRGTALPSVGIKHSNWFSAMLYERLVLPAVLLVTLLTPALVTAQQSKSPKSSAAATRESNASKKAKPASGDTEASADRDQRFRDLVVGTWEDDYQGKRTMTLRKDGTGTMVVVLSGVKASLFASRLQFEMKWSVQKGRLRKRTLRGTPELRVQMILKTMGDRVDEPILELTEKRLLLLDKDGKTKYDWRRVRPPDEPAAKGT